MTSFIFRKTAILLALTFSVISLFSESDSDPFSGSVKVEEGENVIGWESAIFGGKGVKEEKASPDEDKEPEKTENNDKKEKLAESSDDEDVSESETEHASDVTETAETEGPESEKTYSSKDPEWGRYYGKTPELDINDKYEKIETKEPAAPVASVPAEKEPFMFPIDLLLWSHGGDGYNPMINTGVKVSFMNIYSIVSIGTDFSADLYRPLSLGLTAGGFYRLSDFSISADLGYEVIWDFSNNSEINDYALGLRAGLSYNIWSWFAISAGAGVNYSVFKNSNFEDGRFIPMIFGGFESNLIK
ncbi:MAG TPA: hypothetical protein P5044_02760 [bacterium]|nr:hypothetical protein [bacterium]